MGGRGALLRASLGADGARIVSREGIEWDDVRAYADRVQATDAETVLQGRLPLPIPDPATQDRTTIYGRDLLSFAGLPPVAVAVLVGVWVAFQAIGRPNAEDPWWQPTLVLAAGALFVAFIVWFPVASHLATRKARSRSATPDAMAAMAAKQRVWEFRQRSCAAMQSGVAPDAYLEAIGASGIDVHELR